MLVLIGAGLDSKDLSVRALEELKTADKILIESYTTPISGAYKQWISNATNKTVTEIKRPDLEENAKKVIESAKAMKIAIIVPGDPLIATTHHTLIDAAIPAGVEAKVFHAPSIFSAAIGESGLDIYRFGPTTTIAFWSEHYKPTSFLDVINANLRNDQHTLVLLDIDSKTLRPMELMEAMKLLVDAEDQKHYNLIRPELMLLILGDVGKDTRRIAFTSFGNIGKIKKGFDGKIITIIIPATMNFAEKEAMSRHMA